MVLNNHERNLTFLYVAMVSCALFYLFANRTDSSTEEEQKTVMVEVTAEKVVGDVVVAQPTTHISYMHTVLLGEVIETLRTSRMLCTPDDFHNEAKHRMPPPPRSAKKPTSDPNTVLIMYIAVGLLLASMTAAFLDFFKAKNEPGTSIGSYSRKKPSLSRRCSLADLTVMRHDRKELMRKESFIEGGSETSSSRAIGSRKQSLSRRCSLAVIPTNSNRLPMRRTSYDLGESSESTKHSRYRLFLRRH